MKQYIKYFDNYLKESSLFIPRNVDSRFEDLKKPYIDKGYKSEEIFVGSRNLDLLEDLLNNTYKVIIGDFDCAQLHLTNLKGCPEIVTGTFDCSHNKLTSLEGCPIEVGFNFNCAHNKLISLEGCPKEVSGEFNCRFNFLTSLKGCPKEVGGEFNCRFNTTKFTQSEVRQLCYVNNGIYV